MGPQGTLGRTAADFHPGRLGGAKDLMGDGSCAATPLSSITRRRSRTPNCGVGNLRDARPAAGRQQQDESLHGGDWCCFPRSFLCHGLRVPALTPGRDQPLRAAPRLTAGTASVPLTKVRTTKQHAPRQNGVRGFSVLSYDEICSDTEADPISSPMDPDPAAEQKRGGRLGVTEGGRFCPPPSLPYDPLHPRARRNKLAGPPRRWE